MPLKATFQRIDRAIEGVVGDGLNRSIRVLVMCLLGLMLAVFTWLHWLGREHFEIDLYFLAVAVSCFFFRQRGSWIIPLCLLLSDLTELADLRHVLLHNVLQLLQWGFLAFFINVTLSKYVEVRRYQMVIQKDVALARTLQRALMPRYFESPRVAVDARIHQTYQIGGDFYYFRPFKEKYVVFTLGDIMGKGIPASMVMAIVIGFFYEWGKQSFSPAFILERLNERLYSLWVDGESWFVTMFYGIYDEESHELVYSSGGHQAALLMRADAARPIERLKTEGLPVGIFEELLWEEKRVTLEPGDRVAVFTDGINEARNPQGEIFTMERVEQALLEARHLSPGDVARSIVKKVREFAGGGNNLSDDLAIMVMEVKA